MSAKELIIGSGLTKMRVNDSHIDGFVVLATQHIDAPQMSMVAMLDRSEQHLLMLYLQERLAE